MPDVHATLLLVRLNYKKLRCYRRDIRVTDTPGRGKGDYWICHRLVSGLTGWR
jgi:hypothetical protein